MKRRDFIRSMGLSTAGIAGAWLLSGCHTEEDMIGEPNWIIDGDFDRPLPIPAKAGNDIILTAQQTSAQLLPGSTTSILSYRNEALGPTIQVNTGSTVNIKFNNDLAEASNIHWHGLVLPDNMDGHPKDVATPGNSIDYILPVHQRAGTYWYHPHPHGATARQVFMGMAGMFIVNDEEEAALNLPSGDFEVPLIIQDKRFSGSSLDYSPTEDEIMSGYLGEQVLVNGFHSPYLNVEKGWYRFRVLNGSTARLYDLALSNGAVFYIIGSDGGLLKAAEQVTSVFLGPGERLDVLVDFSTYAIGSELFLISKKFSEYSIQGRQGFSLLRFKIDRTGTRSFTLPAGLSNIESIPTALAVQTRTFDVSVTTSGGGHAGGGQHTINGKAFEMEHADDVVQAGTTEIWEFDNTMGDEIHPMHIHGVQFQVLQRTGGRNKIIASEKGWKDTVLLMPGEKVKVIMTFPMYTGMFVLHCHNLEHEDDGMMLNYIIE
jgi:blue copper oxidase